METTNKMEMAQAAHLDTVTEHAVVDIVAKYRKGQAEHGGEIWKKGIATLIGPEIRAEAIDLIVYTECLNDGLRRIRQRCVEETQRWGNAPGADGYRLILAILDGDLVDKA